MARAAEERFLKAMDEWCLEHGVSRTEGLLEEPYKWGEIWLAEMDDDKLDELAKTLTEAIESHRRFMVMIAGERALLEGEKPF